MRTEAEVKADVLAVVHAGSRLSERRDEGWISSLVATTGLSREGVAHALDVSLEREVSSDDLRTLVSRVRPAESVTVVLAANVFTAAQRAIALALAAAPRVYVRPSRRDPTFARALIDAMADRRVTCIETLSSEATRGVVHAYGRDATMRTIASDTGLPVWAHGAGLGVAVVSPRTELDLAARMVADDVVVFDQRGCLSPRVAFVLGDLERAERFGLALAETLALDTIRLPPGHVSPEERAEILRARDVALLCGEVSGTVGAMVAVTPLEKDAACILFPPGRHVSVVPVRDEIELRARLAFLGRALVGVACDDENLARSVAPEWVRIASLGKLQKPPLDGPVDLRDVWLEGPA